MTIVKWDPFKDVSSLQDRINRMFEDFFPRSEGSEPPTGEWDWLPVIDMYETEAGLVIQAELPGVAKEDVSVELKNNLLTLRGQRRTDGDIETRRYVRRERAFGTFQRTFTLNEAVHPEKIIARFKDGILTIEIPREDVLQPKTIKVDID